METLNNVRFILASASPRRHDLLCSVGLPHEIFVTDADETPTGICPEGETYAAWFAEEVSKLKGEAAVAELRVSAGSERVFVISADTVVSPDGVEIYGKPEDGADAVRMLSALSGGVHYVVGGITVSELCGGEVRTASRSVVTKVRFKKLSRAEIDAYVASGETEGKAGAYAIQGLGGVFVTGVEGDYPNVVGISTSVLFDMLESEFSLNLFEKSRTIISDH